MNHSKRIALGIVVALASAAVAAEPPASTPKKDVEPTGSGDASAWLVPPLPDQAKACPNAVPAGDILKVPLFADASARCPVAAVDGEAIPLRDLVAALAGTHEGMQEGKRAVPKFNVLLDRLIDVRLLVLEAREMGLDELPQTKKELQEIQHNALQEALKRKVLVNLKPDPAITNRIYKDMVHEWKVQSVIFAREDEAKAMAAAIKGGKSFAAASKEALGSGKAKGGDPAAFYKEGQLQPPVATALSKLKVGGTTPPVRVQGGWTIVQLQGVRYPEIAAAREAAKQEATKLQGQKELRIYFDGMMKRYAKVDEKLLKSLDFEAKAPGFAAMKKDTRVLATVQDKPVVTVADLATKLEETFYHGIEGAIRDRKVNKQKTPALESLLGPKLVQLEATRLGFANDPEYVADVEAREDQYLFNAVLQKVILPGVKVKAGDVRKYFDEHKADYTYPAFVKLQSIGFRSAKDAQAAAEKLRGGTDFKWLYANSEGKLTPAEATQAPPTTTVSTGQLPAALAKALQGVKQGDVRTYAPAEGQAYAIVVLEQVPPREQPFEDARDGIAAKLHADAVGQAIRDYSSKLRASHKVQVFLTRIGN